jgi:hypothetical protein
MRASRSLAGVRVVEFHVQRVGRERGGIVLVQLEQGRSQLCAAGLRHGVGIGLELVAARELDNSGERKKVNTGTASMNSSSASASWAGPPSSPGWGARPGRCRTSLCRQPAQQRKARQAEANIITMRLHDVAVLEVAQLVRQHGSTSAGRAASRVSKTPRAWRAKAGEVGVGVGLRRLPSITNRPLAGKPQRCISAVTRALSVVGQRLELVEQRAMKWGRPPSAAG